MAAADVRSLSGAPSRVVAVFGSSRCVEESPAYREAYTLGRLLAQAGYVVCNGGYAGAMAAVARGAKEAGGHSVGVTVALFPDRAPNPWLDEVVHAPTLFARLEEFTRRSDAFVVLRGGIGTLLELATVWNLALTGGLGGKPVILLGRHWSPVLRTLRRYTCILEPDVASLCHARTPADVLGLLSSALA